MRFKSIISAVALSAALGFSGTAFAQTMVGTTSVSDVDLPQVTAYCEQLASGMEADSPQAGSIDVTETETDTSGETEATTDAGTGTSGDDEPSLDLGQITLEQCQAAGLVP